MDLDTTQRTALVTDLLLHLQEAALGSYAHLQGSLAENRADQYSDIDVLWEVPDQLFTQCLARLPEILSRVRLVASLRFDPAFHRSDRRRLVYIRFVGVPLFWRVDLDIFARSANRDAQYDCHNSAARGYAWSATESALANAVAAVKAHLRRRDDKAIELLRRGYQRVELDIPDLPLAALLLRLIEDIEARDPATTALAEAVKNLVTEAF